MFPRSCLIATRKNQALPGGLREFRVLIYNPTTMLGLLTDAWKKIMSLSFGSHLFILSYNSDESPSLKRVLYVCQICLVK